MAKLTVLLLLLTSIVHADWKAEHVITTPGHKEVVVKDEKNTEVFSQAKQTTIGILSGCIDVIKNRTQVNSVPASLQLRSCFVMWKSNRVYLECSDDGNNEWYFIPSCQSHISIFTPTTDYQINFDTETNK